MQIGSIGATNGFSSFNINSASNVSHSFAGGSGSSVSEVKQQALLFNATNDLLANMLLDDDDGKSKSSLALDIYSAAILLQNMISSAPGTMSSAMNGAVGGVESSGGVSGVGGVVA